MKTLLYTLALIAAPLATVTAVAAPVEAVDVQKVEAAFAELEQLQVKMVEILETAKDKESADAAAEELFLIIGRVKELQYDARQINRCDAAVMDKARKPLMKSRLAKLLDLVYLAVKVGVYKIYRRIATEDHTAVSYVEVLPAYDVIVFKPSGAVNLVKRRGLFGESGQKIFRDNRKGLSIPRLIGGIELLGYLRLCRHIIKGSEGILVKISPSVLIFLISENIRRVSVMRRHRLFKEVTVENTAENILPEEGLAKETA